ncbi:hypothetical protein [Fredinandcohnia quinoae]|uniref:Uncharacterized protein n=1 Tax=Fredinandcohnia quinoae TaxID=2918902 RepID=A0AAW5EEI8_9BACI|nr:hypothetical protein [Fredinandcohnia sp. SECRCQ15]MCH1627573.1 hypothetical protein [Fredinandcohnia sp. SECRCQ15]
MNAFPNYCEFYQRPLVPIGKSDIVRIPENPFTTHWLIAMEGIEDKSGNKVEHWKVFVFLSDVDGTFEYTNPHFHSDPITSIHSAIEFAKEIESQCKCDQFAVLTPNENIG